MMRTKLLLVFLGIVTGMMALAGPAAAGVNQGDADKVLRVDNSGVWCKDPVPGSKVEGHLTTTIQFHAAGPIAFVTVKSGKDAKLVSYRFDTFWGSITLSKDVSNYVVWTCPGFGKKDTPPPTKTDPPKTDGGKNYTKRVSCRPRVAIVVRGKLVSVDAKSRTLTVLLKKGNPHAKHLIGEKVTFKLVKKATVRIRGKATLADLEAVVGDQVRVIGRACKARLGKKGATPKLRARHVRAWNPVAHGKVGDNGHTKPGLS
jgi:hypothetical protein